MAKAKHKHDYVRYLQQRDSEKDSYDLMKRCKICGWTKKATFKECIIKREDGTFKWMYHLDDFKEVYGELPVVKII